jgi:ABC-type multidrug transport system fused ATPase/permease subunit
MNLIHQIRFSFLTLSVKDKSVYVISIVLQSLIGLLDLIGIATLAYLLAQATEKFSRNPSSTYMEGFFQSIGINPDSNNQYLFLGSMALGLFLAKTILALFFSKRLFLFLSRKQADLSQEIFEKALQSEYTWAKQQDPRKISHAMMAGFSALITNALGQLLLIISELFLILIFFAILFIINPTLAILTSLYFGIVFYFLNLIIGRKVTKYNHRLMDLRLESQEQVQNIYKLFREIRIGKKNKMVSRRMQKSFKEHADFQADDIWIQQIPKYLLEIALLLGVGLIILISSISNNSAEFVTTIAIYLGGSSRMFPSLLRIQGSVFSLRAAHPNANLTIEIMKDLLKTENFHKRLNGNKRIANNESIEELELLNISFRFPESKTNSLTNLNLKVEKGEKLAVIGPSGGGKSTFCDLLLGLLTPTCGDYKINGTGANEWFSDNYYSVSYVPQTITLVQGSIRDNIALFDENDSYDEKLLNDLIRTLGLDELLAKFDNSLNAELNAQSTNLSGGQAQRIAIARALYMRPKLLILDEATSALDSHNESSILEVVKSLSPETIVVFIAHRLSSVKDFSRYLYFSNGEIIADGDLDHIRTKVPEFDALVRNMPL